MKVMLTPHRETGLEPTHTAGPWEGPSHRSVAFITFLGGKTQWVSRFLLHLLRPTRSLTLVPAPG